jgi:hypothetical protein
MNHHRFEREILFFQKKINLVVSQETSRDSVKLNLPDPQEALIDDLARRLNIRRIGWIVTDLVPDESKSGGGPVMHHRGNVVR